ncbi:MAG: oligosaccharide flippase family protein, partial [Acidobacteriota bacterium]
MSLSNGSALSSLPLSIESSEAEPCPGKPTLASLSLTGQVARGSLWSVGGQGVTLLVSLAATPLVIRLLGTEAYGVLALINLMVGYLAFSDLGMGTTSTRFSAEAHARDDKEGEAAVIWMSLLISAVPTLFAAMTLIVMARPLLTQALNVPAHLQPAAVLALRLAALGFTARVAASIINTPQIVRLKMRLNSVITTASSVAQISLTPVVLLMGGGLVGVAAVISGVGMATVFSHALVSLRLLPQMLHPRFDPRLMGRMAKFGGAIVISTLTGILLLNGEKILLTRFSSVNALAYYTVAFSLVSLLTIPANSLVQSLLPTFARLQAGGKEKELQQLYDDMLRSILLVTPVVALLICLGAKKFFIFWAGPDYGVVSPGPFYILMVGLF